MGEKIAAISLASAKRCLEEGNYGRTFAHFLLFLKLEPGRRNEVYYEFALSAREWSEKLEQENRLDDLFKCFDQACEMYPNHDTVLNNIGAQLFRMGYVEEAAAYIRKSLMVNPGYLAARDNLENVCSHLVERWHFSMLNDKRRNFAYQFAIEKAVRSGYDTVLDIGTGTGILSLMCEHSGAKIITAIDRSKAMIEVAKDVLRSNNVGERIHLIHKSSTDMSVPTDLMQKVRLVVTETFDAGLFGEHIVSTMIHAWRNLISTTPMGTSIPCGATMYVCGIECDTIRRKHRLLYPMLQYLDLSCIDIQCVTGHSVEEPYTTENLSNIRGGYKILTNIAELLRVNFTNLCELDGLNSGKSWLCDLYVKQKGRLDALAVWYDLHLDDTVTISTGANNKTCWEQAIYPITNIRRHTSTEYDSCIIKRKETLRTLFKFEQDCLSFTRCEIFQSLQMKDRDHKKGVNPFACTSHVTCKTNDENSGKTLVDVKETQDVSFKESTLPFRKRKLEQLGLQIASQLPYDNDKGCQLAYGQLNLDISESIKPTKETVIQKTGAIQCKSDFSSKEAITANDKDLIIYDESPLTISNSRPSTEVDIGMEQCTLQSKVNVMDLVGQYRDIMLIENVINGISEQLSETKLKHLVDEVDIEFLNDIHLNKQMCHVLETFKNSRNNKDLTILLITSRLTFLAIQAKKIGYSSVIHATQEEHHGILQQVAALNGCKVGDITLIDITYLRDCNIKTDIIVCDVVEPCGAFRQQVLEDVTFHRETLLKRDGILVPNCIRIMGLFIESEELNNLSHVTGNDKTLEYDIADHINQFQMLNHVNIDLVTLAHDKLSETFELFNLDLVSSPSRGGSSLCLIQQTVEKAVDIINTGKISALVYWFEIKMDEQTSVCTLDSRCHWKQACVIIKGDHVVSIHRTLTAKFTLQNSCLDVSVIT